MRGSASRVPRGAAAEGGGRRPDERPSLRSYLALGTANGSFALASVRDDRGHDRPASGGSWPPTAGTGEASPGSETRGRWYSRGVSLLGELTGIFAEYYSESELRQFVGGLPRGAELLRQLPDHPESRAHFAAAVAQALERRREIDADLLLLLILERPRAEVRIRRAAEAAGLQVAAPRVTQLVAEERRARRRVLWWVCAGVVGGALVSAYLLYGGGGSSVTAGGALGESTPVPRPDSPCAPYAGRWDLVAKHGYRTDSDVLRVREVAAALFLACRLSNESSELELQGSGFGLQEVVVLSEAEVVHVTDYVVTNYSRITFRDGVPSVRTMEVAERVFVNDLDGIVTGALLAALPLSDGVRERAKADAAKLRDRLTTAGSVGNRMICDLQVAKDVDGALLMDNSCRFEGRTGITFDKQFRRIAPSRQAAAHE